MRAADVRKSARRVAIARAALLGTFAVLAARAAHLSVFDERGAERGDDQAERVMTLIPSSAGVAHPATSLGRPSTAQRQMRQTPTTGSPG